MNPEHANKQLITFSAVALLFLGSLFYLVSVAFKDSHTLSTNKQAADIQLYMNELGGVGQ